MSTPDSELDRQLRALFGDLDTAADFDARLMARLRAEPHTDATERAMRARQERARYGRAVLELQSRGRSTLRQLTLDTLGIALLLVVAVITAWPQLSRNVMDIWRQYGLYIVMLLSILIAAVPLLGMWAEQTRRPIRLL
ncbi:MAG TPA: hypothetical protein VGG67_06125 [Steroidobacteraceae bacterium]|jgi:hypothetical protein